MAQSHEATGLLRETSTEPAEGEESGTEGEESGHGVPLTEATGPSVLQQLPPGGLLQGELFLLRLHRPHSLTASCHYLHSKCLKQRVECYIQIMWLHT
ncbi:hypothetical protein EYF80_055815 [Liparis tanakae]|uniref:Uncharacterized protein n=1 Tax=Liparis tanakae TaxID=230148 RepID=A0A4Z2EYI5_9TELE|nr:hypothetical protein EYF80_055815 [Liparis tanakae]